MIDIGSLLNNLISPLLAGLPLLIVWIVGIILAITHWGKQPRRSLFTLLAIVIFVLVFIGGILFNNFGPPLLIESGMPWSTYRIIFLISNLVFNLFSTGAWVLLLLAIFKQKKAQQETT